MQDTERTKTSPPRGLSNDERRRTCTFFVTRTRRRVAPSERSGAHAQRPHRWGGLRNDERRQAKTNENEPHRGGLSNDEQKRHTSGQKPVFDPNTATPVRRLRGKIGEAPTWQARAPRQAGISVRILLQVFPLGSWHAPG